PPVEAGTQCACRALRFHLPNGCPATAAATVPGVAKTWKRRKPARQGTWRRPDLAAIVSPIRRTTSSSVTLVTPPSPMILLRPVVRLTPLIACLAYAPAPAASGGEPADAAAAGLPTVIVTPDWRPADAQTVPKSI